MNLSLLMIKIEIMKKTSLILTIGLFLSPLSALADGGFFPPPDYYMYETDQRAMIFYEGGLETLILSATFQGDAKDFGWVVPTPSRPEVGKSSDELFTSLDELTQVEQEIRPMPLGLEEGLQLGQQKDSVYIVETEKIEYYDITVLTADDSQALAKWLEKNKYHFPEEASYILDSYIQNKWFFTAIKIDAEAISPGVTSQLREGHMVPLQLKFLTDKIVFPLRISSVTGKQAKIPEPYPMMSEEQNGQGVSSEMMPQRIPPYRYSQKVGILIYVFTQDAKQALPGFKTQYAGWVKSETIKNLAFDDTGNPWLVPAKDKYFLTKLTRWMSYSEMTNDLYLRNASDNNLVNASPLEDTTIIWFWLVMAISIAFILAIAGTFVYLARK